MPRPILDASESVSGLAVTSLTTASWTIAANSNRLLVAGAATAASTPPTIDEARWGGSGGTLMTQVGSNQLFATFHRNSAWRLVNPTAQTSTLYCAFSGTADEAALTGSAWYGVDQASPISTDQRATGSGASGVVAQASVPGATPYDVIVDFVWTGNGGSGSSMTIAAAPQYNSLEEQENIDNFNAAGHGWRAGAPNVVAAWICSSNVTINWATIVFAIHGVGPNYDVDRPWLVPLLKRRAKGTKVPWNAKNWW